MCCWGSMRCPSHAGLFLNLVVFWPHHYFSSSHIFGKSVLKIVLAIFNFWNHLSDAYFSKVIYLIWPCWQVWRQSSFFSRRGRLGSAPYQSQPWATISNCNFLPSWWDGLWDEQPQCLLAWQVGVVTLVPATETAVQCKCQQDWALCLHKLRTCPLRACRFKEF